MNHVMVVIPRNTDEDKDQQVAREYRNEWINCSEVLSLRHLQLEHHDGDNDGNHAIAERFQARFSHVRKPLELSDPTSIGLNSENSRKAPKVGRGPLGPPSRGGRRPSLR